jgi:hypothetical protein
MMEMQVDDACVVPANTAAASGFGNQGAFDLLQPARDSLTDATLALPPMTARWSRAVVGELRLSVSLADADLNRALPIRDWWTPAVLA